MGSKIYCANVGDSRAVFFYRSADLWYNRALSFDHKPNKTLEAKRILDAGGRVE
jgi:protein phosphatase 2C family protein 2/3